MKKTNNALLIVGILLLMPNGGASEKANSSKSPNAAGNNSKYGEGKAGAIKCIGECIKDFTCTGVDCPVTQKDFINCVNNCILGVDGHTNEKDCKEQDKKESACKETCKKNSNVKECEAKCEKNNTCKQTGREDEL
uniref:Cys-rich protein n=1 Tax=Rhabditophanes sp. KR3021 TaxID=114890 RepID=A0AC35UF32_9BILA